MDEVPTQSLRSAQQHRETGPVSPDVPPSHGWTSVVLMQKGWKTSQLPL